MLTYTFSKREKVLLALLALVAVVIAWYQLVFVRVQTETAELDAQIAQAQDQIVSNQTMAAQLKKMSTEVDAYKAQGILPIIVPNYDNTQSLMAYLNGVIPTDREYHIDFDDPELKDDNTVHRVGQISYETGSYEEARAVIQNIAYGPYLCIVDSLGIVKKTTSGSGASTTFTTTCKLTFIEKATKNAKPSSQGNTENKGQDLSKMSDWNK